MDYNALFIDLELPQPLDQKELLYYFEQYKSGDINARETIVVHNIRLVLNKVYQQYSRTPFEKKDLISSGIMGLIKSVDSFDLTKNIKFLTYANKCIDNEILQLIRKEKKHLNVVSFDELLTMDNDNLKIETVIKDEHSDFVTEIEEIDYYCNIRRLIEELPEYDKKIIVLYYGFNDDKLYTQTEIASILNIDQSKVSILIKEILKKLKIKLQEQEIIGRKKRVKK